MESPVSPSNYLFVAENPRAYANNDDSSGSDSESSDDHDHDELFGLEAKPVTELLDEILSHLHHIDLEQIEHDINLDREHLAAATDDKDNPTVLHILAGSKKDDLPAIAKLRPLVEFLILHPKDLMAQIDRAGCTPLHRAIEEGKKDLVELMCQVHPEINNILSIQSHQNNNCLHIAIKDEVEFLPFLIQHAAPQTLCAKDSNGNTPLHLAVQFDHCKPNQLRIIQIMVAKCDGMMKESEETYNSDERSILTYNDSQLSPYLHHVKSCEAAEADKIRRRQARHAKTEKTARDRNKAGLNRGDGPSGKDDRARRRIAPPDTPGAPRDERRETTGELKPPSRSSTALIEPSGGAYSMDYGGREIGLGSSHTPTHPESSRYYNTRTIVVDDQNLASGALSLYYEMDTAANGSEKGSRTKPSKESIQEIRLFLKQHYLRERNHDAALDILYGRNTTSGESLSFQLERLENKNKIYFDLSGYTTLTRRRLQKGLKNVKFDDTLQYVEVPQITIEGTEAIPNTSRLRGAMEKTDPNGNGRTDLAFIFSWLRTKGVETILQVIVDDLGPQAHGDEAIEEATKGFGVEVWNWKKIDLCAEVIVTAAPTAKVAHLYWTGNNAVLRGWCDVGGLKKLQNLRALYIHVQQGLDSHARTKANMSYFENQMKATRPDLEITWDGLQMPQDMPAAAGSRAPANRPTQASQHDWIRCMTDFKRLLNEAEANFLRTENRKIEDEISEPIKVALIDDGVNISELEYTPIGGRSFCPRTEDKSRNFPYYVSSSGHGTVMASQIYRICPRAQLYVLKLEDYADENGNRQITARSAAQAIRAAVGRGVHIISMSWTLEPPSDERARADLDSAIADAVRRRVLLFCSASDGGAREDLSYPYAAAHSSAFRIGAAYASGATDANVGSTGKIDFTFPGNNVEVLSSLAGRGAVGGAGAGGDATFRYRTGSSVATALAAGLAALVLYCVQVRLLRARRDEAEAVRTQFRRLTEHEQMMKAFRSIGVTEESNYKYVAVWDTFEKPVRKSKEMAKDRWVDLVAGIGAELCLKISA
ncbi:hypothetical protein F4825DRAFT_475545 [Nemania diffusa]|nr:hypothetical protein F4825DRAFT_475545 [Nemania diffusa]